VAVPVSSKNDSIGSKSKKYIDATNNDVELGNMEATAIL